jgi:hypothetical protein
VWRRQVQKHAIRKKAKRRELAEDYNAAVENVNRLNAVWLQACNQHNIPSNLSNLAVSTVAPESVLGWIKTVENLQKAFERTPKNLRSRRTRLKQRLVNQYNFVR